MRIPPFFLFRDSDSDDYDSSDEEDFYISPMYPTYHNYDTYNLPTATPGRSGVGYKRTYDEMNVIGDDELEDEDDLSVFEEEFDQFQEHMIHERSSKRSRLSEGLSEEESQLLMKYATNDINEDEENRVSEVRSLPTEMTEDIIRAYSLQSSFTEALDLVHCVQAMTLGKGGKLKATIMNGQTQIAKCAIRFNGQYVVERTCTSCSDNSIMWCKHIVAVLLKAIRAPDSVLYLGTFSDMLSEAEKGNYLSIAITNVTKGNPPLIHQITKELERLKREYKGRSVEDKSALNSSAFATVPIPVSEMQELLPLTKISKGHYVNERQIFEAVLNACARYQSGSVRCNRSTCHCSCHYRYNYDSSDSEDECERCFSYGGRNFQAISDVVNSYSTCALRMIEKGDKLDLENGMKILESICLAFLTLDISSVPEYIYSTSTNKFEQYDSVVKTLSSAIQTAMLQPDDKVSQTMRDHWIEMLPNWNVIVQTTNKTKANFGGALDAAKNGWHSVAIKKVLDGDETAIANFKECSEIADVRLKILLQQKDVQKACNYARAVGRVLSACVYLFAQGQFTAAINWASQYLTTYSDLVSVSLAAMCYIELSLDEDEVLKDTMVDFIAEVDDKDEKIVMKKSLEFLLGLPTRRSDLFKKPLDQLSEMEQNTFSCLHELKCFMEEMFLEQDVLVTPVRMRLFGVEDKRKDPYLLSKAALNFHFATGSDRVQYVELSPTFSVIALMCEFFEDSRDTMYDFFMKHLDPEDHADLRFYLAVWFGEYVKDFEKAFELGIHSFLSVKNKDFSFWFCQYVSSNDTPDNKMMDKVCSIMTSRQCKTKTEITELVECSKNLKLNLDILKTARHAVEQTFKLAFEKGTPIDSYSLRHYLLTATDLCRGLMQKSDKAPTEQFLQQYPEGNTQYVDDLIMFIGIVLDAKSPPLSAVGKYLRTETSATLTTLNELVDLISDRSTAAVSKKLKLSSYALAEVSLNLLDVGASLKPASYDSLRTYREIISRSINHIRCYCSDCSRVKNWVGSYSADKSNTFKIPFSKVCVHIKTLSNNDTFSCDIHEGTPSTVTITKKDKLQEALQTVRTSENARNFEEFSRTVVEKAMHVARQADIAYPLPGPLTRLDVVLEKIQSHTNTNFAILQKVLDHLLEAQRFIKAIEVANKLLTLPNDSIGTPDIMSKLITASQKQADEYKQQPDMQQKYEDMKQQCIQLARKDFQVRKTVESFDRVKQILIHFGNEEEWAKERPNLLLTFLNTVRPENTTIPSTYNLPAIITTTLHLLIRDSYLQKANEILLHLIKRHNSEEVCAMLLDHTFQYLVKYQIVEQLIVQYFQATVQYYGEVVLKTRNFDSVSTKHPMYNLSNTPATTHTGDSFWTQHTSLSPFEKHVIEKWCTLLMPDLAIWFMQKKLTDWHEAIRVGNYEQVVTAILKVKKCYELAGKTNAEWTKTRITIINKVKTKKKLVSTFNQKEGGYIPKTQKQRDDLVKAMYALHKVPST
jgi:hypothetical protein